jgi:hypothetical protein
MSEKPSFDLAQPNDSGREAVIAIYCGLVRFERIAVVACQ